MLCNLLISGRYRPSSILNAKRKFSISSSKKVPLKLKTGRFDPFNPKGIQKVFKEDGVSSEWTLIYREVFAYKAHINFQVFGSAFVLGAYFLANRKWSEAFLFTSYIGPSIVACTLIAISLYNLRMGYRVPRRMYYNQTNEKYQIVLNHMMSWRKPQLINFKLEDMKLREVAGKDGWLVTGITQFHFLPKNRILWLDKDSFAQAHYYWTLCGKNDPKLVHKPST